MVSSQNISQIHSIKVAGAISDVIQSTLGPRSSLKMILDNQGRLIVTNDGNCILREIEATHPIACSLIELSRAQENEVGDGTTSVVIMASEILKITEILLKKGFNPNQIIGAYYKGLNRGIFFLEDQVTTDIKIENFDEIKKVVSTCIGTKLVSRFSRLICELSFKAMKNFGSNRRYHETKYFVKVEKITSGSIEQSKIFPGLMLEKDVSHSKMRRFIDNPKIILLDCPIEFKKGETLTSSFEITGRKQWEKILKMEEDHVIYLCNLLKIFNPDLIISEKAVSEIAIHYLNKLNISVLKRVKKSDNIRISKATGATVVSSIEDLEYSDLGKASKFVVKKIGDENYSFIIGKHGSFPCTALLFGPSRDILDEMERNLNDAIEVTKTILSSPKILPGGGASEMAIADFLLKKSEKFKNANFFVFKTMAMAFEIIPKTLIQNCGNSPIHRMNQLRNFHSHKGFFFGIDGKNGNIIDTRKTGIFDIYHVKVQIFKIAFENAATILRIDKIISGISPKNHNQDLTKGPKKYYKKNIFNFNSFLLLKKFFLSAPRMSFVHYRVSTLGIELEETLQEFLREKVVDVDLLEVIRKEFDKAMVTVLKKMVKDKPVLKGKLKHYQNCENVWIFHIANPEIRVSNYSLPIQMNGPLKIVGCDSKLITSLERKKEKKGKKIRVRK